MLECRNDLFSFVSLCSQCRTKVLLECLATERHQSKTDNVSEAWQSRLHSSAAQSLQLSLLKIKVYIKLICLLADVHKQKCNITWCNFYNLQHFFQATAGAVTATVCSFQESYKKQWGAWFGTVSLYTLQRSLLKPVLRQYQATSAVAGEGEKSREIIPASNFLKNHKLFVYK